VSSDTLEKLSLMKSTLKEIRAKNRKGANPPIAGTFVIYNFPDRDCSAKSSAGELVIAEDGEERYRIEYIDEIAKIVKEYSDIRMIFVFGQLKHPQSSSTPP
jgi:cellulose 1,4-beta-cellobiosidase